nr:retrotransposable element Tf2 [Tanacetum cinerariifolium]
MTAPKVLPSFYTNNENIRVEVMDRTLVARDQAIRLLQFYLKRTQNTMKSMADKQVSDREFKEEDWLIKCKKEDITTMGSFPHCKNNGLIAVTPMAVLDRRLMKNKNMIVEGKYNGENILQSIDEGPFKIGKFRETLADAALGGQAKTFDVDVDEAPIHHLALNEDHVFQADQCDAFNSDVDEAPTAQTMFMTNLSSADLIYDEAGLSYDLDILSKVQDHDNYLDSVGEYHEVHEMQIDVQQNYVVDSDVEYRSDSNIILYEWYVKNNTEQVVQRFPALSIRSSNAITLDSPYMLVLITGTSQSKQHGRFNFRRTSLTGFPAQSVRSSNAIALDSPYLLVLNTRASQSRQHVDTSLIHIESRKSPTAELFDVDSRRISIRHCEY